MYNRLHYDLFPDVPEFLAPEMKRKGEEYRGGKIVDADEVECFTNYFAVMVEHQQKRRE